VAAEVSEDERRCGESAREMDKCFSGGVGCWKMNDGMERGGAAAGLD
jgi:hypothetical protein